MDSRQLTPSSDPDAPDGPWLYQTPLGDCEVRIARPGVSTPDGQDVYTWECSCPGTYGGGTTLSRAAAEQAALAFIGRETSGDSPS